MSVVPRDLAEAEDVVREAAGARDAEPLPRGYPDRQVVALSMVVEAILDDLRRSRLFLDEP